MSTTIDFKTWMRGHSSRKPTDVDAIIARNLRFARSARKMSQTTLAARLGLTFQQIQKYEDARNRISASRLVDIAKALDCPVSDFFAGTS